MADIQISEVDAKFWASLGSSIKFYILIDLQRMNHLQNNIFPKNQEYENGWWSKFKIHISIYGDTS
jgi:hypothetical protein